MLIREMPDSLPYREEIVGLDALEELAGTPFPFRGLKDFRGFIPVDWKYFSYGVFQNADKPRELKWQGGSMRAGRAIEKLLELGYVLHSVERALPHVIAVRFMVKGL